MKNEKLNIIPAADYNLFESIKIEDFKNAAKYIAGEQISEYGISPICVYAPYDNIKYAVYNDFLLTSYIEDDVMFTGISGDYTSPLFETVLKELYEKNGYLNMKYLSAQKKDRIKNIFTGYAIKEKTETDQYDYLYERESFINLSGRINRHKRENYNSFINNNNYSYEKMTKENAPDCMAITEAWCKRKDCSECEYCCEKDIISVLIDNWDEYPIEGGLIYIDSKPMAFLMAEPVGNILMGYHQKTLSPEIKGLGYAIYIEALKSNFSYIKYFNIGPDIGITGLRQFKRSFKPFELVEKWELNISD